MKKTLLFMFTVLLSVQAQAQQLSAQEALTKARQFMQGKTFAQPARARGAQNDAAPYYIFNAQEGGFVIISGDERTDDVLAYSENGRFDMDDMPGGLKYLLDKYESEIKFIQANNLSLQKRAITRAAIASAKGPFLDFGWNQKAPFNKFCKVTPAGSSEVQCPTGCVATAMAMILYYNAIKHTQSTLSIGALEGYDYTYSGKTCTVDGLVATTINWDNIKKYYADGETGTKAEEVAKLMYYCGVSVGMKYYASESSAGFRQVMDALRDKFGGYSNSVEFVLRSDYSWSEWENMMREEINADRAVLYGAQNSIGSGGHAFILDGYDEKGRFHVNWGWGRYGDGIGSESDKKNNGYFLLTVMEVTVNDALHAFNSDEDAVIGIDPEMGAKPIKLTATNLEVTNDFKVQCTQTNKNSETYYFDLGYGYTGIDVTASGNYSTKTNKKFSNGDNYNNADLSFSIATLLAGKGKGTYKIFPVSKLNSASDWQPSLNPDLMYVRVDWSGSAVTSASLYYKVLNNVSDLTRDFESYKGKDLYVDFSRSVPTAGTSITICFPFEYTAKAEDGDWYTFAGVSKVGDEWQATMTEVGTGTILTANKPYLLKPKGTGIDFSDHYTLAGSITAGSTTSGDWEFKGVYASKTWTEAGYDYGFAASSGTAKDGETVSAGDFVKVGSGASIAPMRAYLTYTGAGARGMSAEALPDRITVVLLSSSGGTTAIGEINTRTGETSNWFDLNGRRLDGKPAQKGIYINNGKKVVVK